MRVLVTGANGCIGTWVLKNLLDRGIEVAVFDVENNLSRLGLIAPENQLQRVVQEPGNIADTARVKALVKDGAFTHIIHLAAVLMPFCQANPVEGGLVNVIGTLNLFEAARDAGRGVRIVYASSSAVWGPEDHYESGKLDERQHPDPSTHYGVFKHANEGNARVFYQTNGISSIGLRPWTVYGVGRDRGLTADPTFAMLAAARRQPYQIRLTGYMDLQFVEDVAETFVRCALSPLEGARVYNLEGEVVAMQELIGIIDRIRPGTAAQLSAAGPQVPVAFRLDGSSLRASIEDLPNTPLPLGVEKTITSFERLIAAGRM